MSHLDYGVCCGWFSVYTEWYVIVFFGDGNVQKIDFIIIFFFHSEFHDRCYVVEYSEYVMYISYSVFISYEKVIFIEEISSYMRFQQNFKYLYILMVL